MSRQRETGTRSRLLILQLPDSHQDTTNRITTNFSITVLALDDWYLGLTDHDCGIEIWHDQR